MWAAALWWHLAMGVWSSGALERDRRHLRRGGVGHCQGQMRYEAVTVGSRRDWIVSSGGGVRGG